MKRPQPSSPRSRWGSPARRRRRAPAQSATRLPTEPPAIKPANFVRNVGNPWFPLKPGTTLTYAGVKDGKQARNVFHVTHKTEKIKGVRATVIRDRLYLDGKLGEDTTDWYAQDKRGDVVYRRRVDPGARRERPAHRHPRARGRRG